MIPCSTHGMIKLEASAAGWHLGYAAALTIVEEALLDARNNPRTRLADLPGLQTALTLIEQIRNS